VVMMTDAIGLTGFIERSVTDPGRYIHLIDDREDGECVTIADEDDFMSAWISSDVAFDVEAVA